MQTETPAAPEVAELPMFSELGLPEHVERAVEEAGYHTPTRIQAEAIPQLLEGKDLIGGSQTGTGKTAAFALPILARLGEHKKTNQSMPRCLILEPTRELAVQVFEAFEKYGKHSSLKLALLYGGVKYGRQREQLDAGADIVIATPGRLLDHYGQKNISFKGIQIMVLDEADRMLDMGFMPDVRKIIEKTPRNRQSLLFSATVPPAIEHLSSWMLKEPVTIRIGGGTSAAETVSHYIYPVDDRQKFDLFVDILKNLDFKSVLVFCRTKATTDTLGRWLENYGHGKVSILHSNRTQRERQEALDAFRKGKTDILVATDIVARGIDIRGITHVINYDIPQHCEDYVHRIGRTGRAMEEGDAITLYTASEQEFLTSIERFIGQKIPRKKLEDFDYKWSPVLEETKPKKKKRNRGFNSRPASGNWKRR